MAGSSLIPRVCAIVVVTAVVMVYAGQHLWSQTVTASVDRLYENLHGIGWAGVILVQVMIAASGVLPASLIGVSAGAAYGVTLGFAMSSVSLLTGAIAAFLLSRSLFRPFIERRLRGKPRLSSFDRQIQKQGWRLVCLVRLSPVMPFAAVSYALGLSSITLGAYVVGTLASLPSLLGYVLVGVFVKMGVSAWSDGGNTIQHALLAIGVLSMAILAMRLARLLRRAVLAPESPRILAP